MMELHDIISAVQSNVPGRLDLVIDATIEGERGNYPYTYAPGDTYGLAPLIAQYLSDHPDLPISNAPPPMTTGAAVDAERERRIGFPLAVAVPSGASFQINMDPASQRNIQGLSTVGMILKEQAPTQTTSFRDFANVTHDLLPDDLIAMGLQAAARIEAVYQKSWALKAMDPIPGDYSDDAYW